MNNSEHPLEESGISYRGGNPPTVIQPLGLQDDNWQQKLIGRVKDRFNELEEKKFQWHSFYHGWLEGRFDMKVSATPPPAEQRGYEKAKQEFTQPLGIDVDELIKLRNELYEDLPKGETTAWELLSLIKVHINDLDSYINRNSPSLPQSSTSEEAIGFAEWKEKNYRGNGPLYYNEKDSLKSISETEYFNIPELYNLYKQSKK